MSKKDKFHALLAVEGDVKNQAELILKESKQVFGKHENFTSTHEVYTPLNEEGLEIPEKKVEMVTTVDDRLRYTEKFWVRLIDVIYQKELTNCEAKADLVVGETIIATGIPATALLAIEGRLKQLREMYQGIPTLKPGVIWSHDEGDKPGIYIAPEQHKIKTEKLFHFEILFQPTDTQPGQVEKMFKDQKIGDWKIQTRCGMWTSARKAEVMEKVDNLIRCVKKARQRASSHEVVLANIGKALFDHINT